MKKGREKDDEITIFDSTGLTILDIISAKLTYEKAKEREITKGELIRVKAVYLQDVHVQAMPGFDQAAL